MDLNLCHAESNLDEEKLIGWRGEVRREGGDSTRHDGSSGMHQDGSGNGGKLASTVRYNQAVCLCHSGCCMPCGPCFGNDWD